jgi:WD40 repeat protein
MPAWLLAAAWLLVPALMQQPPRRPAAPCCHCCHTAMALLRQRVQCVRGDDYAMQICVSGSPPGEAQGRQRLWLVCSDQRLRLHDPCTASLRACGEYGGHTDRINDAVACGGGGTGLVLTSSSDGTARLWDERSPNAVQQFGAGGGPELFSACVDAQQSVVATGGAGGVVQLWDCRAGRQRCTLTDQHTDDVTRVRFQPPSFGELTGERSRTLG